MFDIVNKALAITKAKQDRTAGGSNQYLSGKDPSTSVGANNGGDVELMTAINTIINVVLGVIGVIAVVMIIMGGIQYTTSSGDTQKVKKAKDTILYGIIGLVVALLAFAIVNFVLGNVFGS